MLLKNRGQRALRTSNMVHLRIPLSFVWHFLGYSPVALSIPCPWDPLWNHQGFPDFARQALVNALCLFWSLCFFSFTPTRIAE